MEIKEAQEVVDKAIKEYGGYWEPLSMMARLTEEVGELARAMNLKYGGKKKKFDGDGRAIEEELSDVFITVLTIANHQRIDVAKSFNDKVRESHSLYKKTYSGPDNKKSS